MGYLPKQMVEKAVKVRLRRDKNGREFEVYEAYLGIDPFTQKPVRISRTEKGELQKEIQDFYARHKVGGDAAVRLTAIQSLDAKNAYDALANANLRMSLTDAVNAYIGGRSAMSASTSAKKIQEAYDEYYASKADGADKDKTKATVGRWAGGCNGRQLVSVTAREMSAYLEKNFGDRKPKTYNSHLRYLKTFFNWCCKDEREYLAKNPIKSLENRPEPWEEPEYMKPVDVERLFRLLEAHKADRPELLAYAVVNFFCGCRAIEIQRMASDPDAAKINIEGETVRIAKAKGYQQGKRPRAFPIHPTALAWMKSFDFLAALAKVSKGTQKEIYDLARENGIPMFHNCGRHTFITYHVAAYNDPAKTTAMVGTSEKMRADNYCGLAEKKDGEAYFKILPSAQNAASAA
jgi:integrase